MLAVAQDGDAVGDQQRLLQRVRDEDDRDAARLQLARPGRRSTSSPRASALAVGSSKMMTWALCSTARAISTICFLAGAERPTVAVGSTSKLQRLQELLRGDVDAAQAVEEFLLAEEEVLRDRHRRHQAVLLEHHGDAELAAPRPACSDATSLAVDQHLAGGRGRRRRPSPWSASTCRRRSRRPGHGSRRVAASKSTSLIAGTPRTPWSPCAARGCGAHDAICPLDRRRAAAAAARPAALAQRRRARPSTSTALRRCRGWCRRRGCAASSAAGRSRSSRTTRP